MGISAEEALAVGGTLDDARLPEEMGGGYMASVEVVHQLHCLNFLRKATHQDYYQSRALEFQDPPHTVRVHLDHCIEMLRQFLMCNADAGLYTHRWIENYPRPYPNFNTWHKCRNFENVLEYAKSHQIKPPPGWHYPVPAGAHIFPDAQVPSEAPQLSEIPVV
ncbi:hypothetical protein MMC18_004083 [Xylographa bjoerkii]|nr:hypothetical protein [Xylographa bjoerkii]